MAVIAKWGKVTYNVLPSVLKRYDMMILDFFTAIFPAVAAYCSENQLTFCLVLNFSREIPTHDCDTSFVLFPQSCVYYHYSLLFYYLLCELSTLTLC